MSNYLEDFEIIWIIDMYHAVCIDGDSVLVSLEIHFLEIKDVR